jgi:hypothetical protein
MKSLVSPSLAASRRGIRVGLRRQRQRYGYATCKVALDGWGSRPARNSNSHRGMIADGR